MRKLKKLKKMNTFNGAICIVLSTIFFTLMGTCVKWAQGIPFHELVFFRSVMIFLIAMIILKTKNISVLGNDRMRLVMRGLTGATSLFLYFFTIQKIPYAVAVTLQYLSPVFTILISGLILKESASWKQWVAVICAFGAVALVQVNAGGASAGLHSEIPLPYTFMGIFAAFLSAASYTNIRALNKSEHPLVIVLYLSMVTLIMGGPYTVSHWVNPTMSEWGVLIIMGGVSYLGQYFLTLGYQRDKAPKMASLAYLNVVWAVLLGEFLWGEHLAISSVLGIVTILFCALISQ